MSGRSWERTAKLAAAVISLAAAAMAFYVQLFEVRARQEESRLAALRLESALAESRSRLKAEILAELRAGGASEGSGGEPIPGSVLRRPESAASGDGVPRSLESILPAPPLTLSGVAQGLEQLSQQTREIDQALRRDLEEFRAATRRELDASAKATVLSLVALIPLALYLLLSYWLGEPSAAPGAPQPDRSARGY
jgi:hypothetical protein